MINKKSFFIIIFIIISLITPSLTIFQNKKIILERFQPDVYEKKYYQSQWAIPNSKNPISDIDLYAYSGYKYINGENPILISPEVPPLGKYLIGLSILIFNNHRIINILFAYLTLLLVFYLSFQLTKSGFCSSLALFLTSINSLFIDQIANAGQMEIFQLFFLLFFTATLARYFESKKSFNLLLSGIFLGVFVSFKFFVYFYLLINLTLILFFFLYLKNKKEILTFLKIIIFLNIISLTTYSLSYFQFFIKNRSPLKFFGVQKWILKFYLDSNIEKVKIVGSYLALIFFNRWRYWSNNYPWLSYERWSFFWPIVFILGIIAFIKLHKNKSIFKQPFIKLMFSFFLSYNFFLFITPIYPRYLLLLLVPLNIVVPFILK